jgi:hypothetical protein
MTAVRTLNPTKNKLCLSHTNCFALPVRAGNLMENSGGGVLSKQWLKWGRCIANVKDVAAIRRIGSD